MRRAGSRPHCRTVDGFVRFARRDRDDSRADRCRARVPGPAQRQLVPGRQHPLRHSPDRPAIDARSRSAKKSRHLGVSPARESRECGSTRTGPDDEDSFRGVHEKSPVPRGGRTRLTYRIAPALAVGTSTGAGRQRSILADSAQSIFLSFSVRVSISLSSFFSQVPVTSTLIGSSLEAPQNPRLL